MLGADASGIGERPEEIFFYNINGHVQSIHPLTQHHQLTSGSDGKVDYVWTREIDGAAYVWLKNYPNSPTWLERGQIASGVGTSGMNVRWANLQDGGRASYVSVSPDDGATANWLNRCKDFGPEPNSRPNGILIDLFELYTGAGWSGQWYVYEITRGETVYVCDTSSVYSERAQSTANNPGYPETFEDTFDVHGAEGCQYEESSDEVGRLICRDMPQTSFKRPAEYDETFSCRNGASVTAVLECWW